MVFQNGDVSISKAVLIPASILAGTGMAYMMYQIYVCSQRCRVLNLQVSILTQKLMKLETEISEMHLNLNQEQYYGSSDEEFEDASDGVEISQTIKRTSENDRQSSLNGDGKKLNGLISMLDVKIEQGGLQNLTLVYDRLSQLSHIHPKECDVYWRLAQVAFLLVSEEEMDNPNLPIERRNDLMLKAKTAAENALKCNSECPEAHKWAQYNMQNGSFNVSFLMYCANQWMAIVLGSAMKDLPMKNQIEYAFVIKDHLDVAIKGRPFDATMHHIRGRWCFSIYMLSWIERKLAAALFAKPPTATLEEATQYFEKAEELNPCSSMDNLLYLGKVYIAVRDYEKAVTFLMKGESLTCTRPDDFKSLGEIKQLLKQYKKYVNGS